MISSPVHLDSRHEFHRLQNLLPNYWQAEILICSSPLQKSGRGQRNQQLISTSKKADQTFVITIDLQRWQYLEEDARNLLWWHELARIQQHSVGADLQTIILGMVGLCLATGQLISQDIVLLAIGLTVSGMAGFQLYQRRRGEQYLRQLTQADQGAIAIAGEHGYSPAQAYASLHSALKILTAQVTSGQLAKNYRTRLQVLEICKQSMPLAVEFSC